MPRRVAIKQSCDRGGLSPSVSRPGPIRNAFPGAQDFSLGSVAGRTGNRANRPEIRGSSIPPPLIDLAGGEKKISRNTN